MRIRTLMRMPMYALAAYGAKTLWDRYSSEILPRPPGDVTLSDHPTDGSAETGWIRVETTSLT